MTTTHFATPEEAQAAFYNAIERADLSLMMAVWSEEEDVVCVHPGGKRFNGIDQVRESWRQIFLNGPELKFRISNEHVYPGRILSVHSAYEYITHIKGSFSPTSVVTTNIYLLASHGWRMLVHHASPIPGGSAEEAAPPILH